MIDLKHRKVKFFRAHIDPGCHPMPKNACMHTDFKAMELIPAGVYVMNHKDEEFIVPFSNIQTLKLMPVEEPAK